MHGPFDLAQIGKGLAFAAHAEELLAHLGSGACVVQAPPGSGKTTIAPPAAANHLARRGGPPKVLVTAPRRMAVRAAADRLSQLDGSALGERSGYTIRGERARSEDTLVEFLTPGVLLRRLIADPELPGVGAVIIDEVHERSLDTDLLLGMLTELRELRDDLVLVAMSATVEAERFAELLGGVPVLESSGEQYPVTVQYAPFNGSRFTERGIDRRFLDHVAETVTRAASEGGDCDILVFLPGRSEISYVADLVSRKLPALEVLPLFSGAPPQVQRKVLSGRPPNTARRVIVSTDVAESSLTVPGVHIVIDSCLARESRWDARRGMSGLVTISASHASSDQRAGRAGRQGPGRAYRCVDDGTYASAPAVPTPEIATARLTTAALMLACWGAPGGEGMAFPDPFPPQALNDAHAELRRLGALDPELRPTVLGRRLARLPLDPSLGRALLQAADEVGAVPAAEIVALLATDVRAQDADLPGLFRQLRSGTHPDAKRWSREATRLSRLLPNVHAATPHRRATANELGYVAALGTGRIARRDGESYLLASGTRASLPTASPLAGEQWLVITEVARSRARAASGTGAIIRGAAPISLEDLEEVYPPETSRRTEVVGGRVRAREERTFGRIIESSTPVATTTQENADALSDYIKEHGLGVLTWGSSASQLRGRLAAVRAHLGDPWPDVSEEALTRDLSWLIGYITEPELKQIPVAEGLTSLVRDRVGELDRLAPKKISVPSGRAITVDYPYPPTDSVKVSVKLQECFGMRSSPTIMAGRVPVTLELLSPANRPLAVTNDLEFFWSQVYPQVRAENRARYSKHPWPEDPWAHKATAATNRQLQRRQ